MSKHEYRPHDFTGTPFNESAAPLSSTSLWIAWGPYHIVDYYSDPVEETLAIRNSVVLEDKSPLVKTFITGPDAERLVDYMQVRDTTKMENYHANYTFWCDQNGHVVSEGILFKLEVQRYVYLAGPVADWCRDNAEGFDVEINEAIESNQEFGVLAVQGPKSEELMKAVTGDDFVDLKFSRARKIKVEGVELTVWRTGYTGEIGFEIWVPEDGSAKIFKKIADTGRPLGAVPIGNAAQVMARVEVGMLLIWTDYKPGGPDSRVQIAYMKSDEHLHTPTELNFGRLVNLKKASDFIGKAALQKEAETGPHKIMLGLEVNWHEMAVLYEQQGMPPMISTKCYRVPFDLQSKDGQRIGFATSITWSPNINKMIGFAHVGSGTAPGQEIDLLWTAYNKTGPVTATLVELPFTRIVRSRK